MGWAAGERLHTLNGHGRHVRAVSFNAHGTLLAGCGNDGSVRLWDAASRRLAQRLQGSADGLITLESGATANDDDTVTLWTRETGGEQAVCAAHRGRVRSIAFDAAGATMATGCDDGHVRLWDVASGDLLAGQFWHVIGLCRFGAGELDPYLPRIRQMELDDSL
ncbi:hypothetical protein [Nocardia sp. NPDC051981]|uniref:WD40 repeat domain-containing protein n=1 Tax=Nocardia sp. NPDC051981 TaxID=3155417 RepID=UPI003432A9D5